MDSSIRAPLRQAAERFAVFFRELGERFVERDDVLVQIALALLSRQHVLLTGPPGTAKSQLAHRVLGRIVSEETGRPSLFSRQFTESTVQTDLVGPMDFRTLMDTGRTEHFTDEGILGAVHAFLDEVFDGRDMLLRSTLNLLQERELKAGTKTTAGKIECALMTTNRYLAEILDNERLVAFVDRIAFLAFVPRGFAAPKALDEVLRTQVGGRRPPELTARLTIQDLDVLQAAVDDVFIDDSICVALAELARAFDAEAASARRANPMFVPSRYLSTRTVVRMGLVLRAACVYDWIAGGGVRALQVLRSDLAWLRLGMTLAGPKPDDVPKLLEAETDPRERRQLSIVRTEGEIFARCLAALPAPAQPERPRVVPPGLLADAAPEALARHDGVRLAALSRSLAAAAASGQTGAAEAGERLQLVLREIVERAMRSCLEVGSSDEANPVTVASRLAVLAGEVERAGPTHARAARWLRTRALEVIEGIMRLSPAPVGDVLARTLAAPQDLASLVDSVVARLEKLRELRDGLRHAGADEPDPAAADAEWNGAAERLAATLGPVMASGLAAVAAQAMVAGRRFGLPGSLERLAPTLAQVRLAVDRVAALGADATGLFAAAASGVVKAVAERAYAKADGASREQIVALLEKYAAALGAAGVLEVLAPGDLLDWSMQAVLRGLNGAPATVIATGTGAGGLDFDGYRRLRREMPRGTFAGLAVDVCMRILPAKEPGGNQLDNLRDPDRVLGRVAEIVRSLPQLTRATLVRHDLDYLEAPVSYLERWWKELAAGIAPGAAPPAALEQLVKSRFFKVTHDEGALARFALEARLVATVLGDPPAEPLCARLAALEAESTALVDRLLAAGQGGGGEGGATRERAAT